MIMVRLKKKKTNAGVNDQIRGFKDIHEGADKFPLVLAYTTEIKEVHC